MLAQGVEQGDARLDRHRHRPAVDAQRHLRAARRRRPPRRRAARRVAPRPARRVPGAAWRRGRARRRAPWPRTRGGSGRRPLGPPRAGIAGRAAAAPHRRLHRHGVRRRERGQRGEQFRRIGREAGRAGVPPCDHSLRVDHEQRLAPVHAEPLGHRAARIEVGEHRHAQRIVGEGELAPHPVHRDAEQLRLHAGHLAHQPVEVRELVGARGIPVGGIEREDDRLAAQVAEPHAAPAGLAEHEVRRGGADVDACTGSEHRHGRYDNINPAGSQKDRWSNTGLGRCPPRSDGLDFSAGGAARPHPIVPSYRAHVRRQRQRPHRDRARLRQAHPPRRRGRHGDGLVRRHAQGGGLRGDRERREASIRP